MGTRGLFGIKHKGRKIMFYNHFDSYYSGLGSTLVNEIIEAIKSGAYKRWKTVIFPETDVDDSPCRRYASYADLFDSGKLIYEIIDDSADVGQEYVYLLDLDDDLFYWNSGYSISGQSTPTIDDNDDNVPHQALLALLVVFDSS